MAHPHRSNAGKSSKNKMRALTGNGGGGSPFGMSSHFKKPGKHGELKSYDAHRKTYVDAQMPAAKPKARADKFARGGRTKKKGDVNVAIVMPHHGQQQPPPSPPPQSAAPPPAMPPAPGGMPGGAPGTPGSGVPPGALSALIGTGQNAQAPLGKAFKDGGRLKSLTTGKDMKKWKNYAEGTKSHRKEGGRLNMTAGAQSGEGRLEQMKFYKKHRSNRRGKV